MNSNPPIQFRAHHFLCALCFQGKGYSPEFVSNFSQIMQGLNEDDSTSIEVVAQTDSICAPCPNRLGKRCETQAKIEKLDQAHAQVLGLKVGDSLTWKEAKLRIKEKMTLDKFHQSCKICSWKPLGICESVLEDKAFEKSQ